MSTYLQTKVDFGSYGVIFSETREEHTRKSIAREFAEGQFDPHGDGLGLLQVFEINTDAGTCVDITKAICEEAEHYITANCESCDGNRIRLMVQCGVLDEDVCEIKKGELIYSAVEHDRIAA